MNKPVDFTEEEKAILNMTSQSVDKDLLSALIDEIRTLPELWHKLSEQKQADIIERCGKRVDYNVKRAVHLIASDGRIVVAGDVDQIVIKDGVKAVIKFGKNAANLHHLYESESNAVLVVVANPSDFTGGMDEVQPDPDQPNLYDDLGGDGVFADVSECEVIDVEIMAIGHQPLESELQQAYEDGYEAAKNGYDKTDCPDFAEAMRIEWCNGFNAFFTGNSEEPVRTMKQGQPPNENGVYLVEDEVILWSHKKDNLEIKLLELENGQWIYSVTTQFGTSGSRSPLTLDDHAALSRDYALLKAQEDLKRIVGNSGLTGAALSSLDAFIDGLWHSDEHAA